MGLASLALGFNAVSNHLPKSQYPVCSSSASPWADWRTRCSTSTGVSSGILLYCIGPLSIVGPMMSALYGDNTYLFTNATLDLVISAVLATTYGIGIVLAAPVLFCWQGAIYLISTCFGNIIPDALVTEVSIVGSILIAASGLGILEIKSCKPFNLLPSLLVPMLFFLLKELV